MSETLITFLASFLLWFMFGGLLVLWIIDGRVKKEIVLHIIISVILVFFLCYLIKLFVPSVRPFYFNGRPSLSLTTHANNAFPSTHTAVAFALATTLYLHDKKLGKAYLIIAFLVGIGRILANVHYRVDVLAGASLGLLVSLAVDRFHFFGLLKK